MANKNDKIHRFFLKKSTLKTRLLQQDKTGIYPGFRDMVRLERGMCQVFALLCPVHTLFFRDDLKRAVMTSDALFVKV